MSDEKQKFYLIRGYVEGKITILKQAPDDTKFKFVRMLPSENYIEEWVDNENYDTYVKAIAKE